MRVVGIARALSLGLGLGGSALGWAAPPAAAAPTIQASPVTSDLITFTGRLIAMPPDLDTTGTTRFVLLATTCHIYSDGADEQSSGSCRLRAHGTLNRQTGSPNAWVEISGNDGLIVFHLTTDTSGSVTGSGAEFDADEHGARTVITATIAASLTPTDTPNSFQVSGTITTFEVPGHGDPT